MTVKEFPHPFITKSTGDVEPFSPEKLQRSLKRAGASEQLIGRIMDQLLPQLYDGMPTKKIYQLAFKILRGSSRPLAARYRLKSGIMELGPSGYPFEKFVGEVLRNQGFTVEVGVTIKGRCVNHEVDVLAGRGNDIFMVECKFHNHPEATNNVKIPLYIQARFEDIKTAWKELPEHKEKLHQGWVVTNTRFTSDAIQYAECIGLKLIGWNYPRKGNLQDLIESEGLYPLTVLTTLTKSEKQQLLDRRIVLCHELAQHPAYLEQIGIKGNRLQQVKSEAEQLSQHLFAYGID
ncbi:restriction endonuclease [Adhaeribacter soli]|uniref:ATPase n=1 Tax=Adhaeribacter soli TaxID=2607655 RepID=A0A5N1IN73_9BACT|nr:restriction endonuclease [Adhaeribacter soli]KAA9324930.1 ATPase [Adhaeribacter soli]